MRSWQFSLMICAAHLAHAKHAFSSRALRNTRYMRFDSEDSAISEESNSIFLDRKKRFFGTFSVIEMLAKNCRYDAYRNGTCITNAECRLAGGKSSMTSLCGLSQSTSLGECCLLQNTCGETQSGRNNTIFVNPEYPDFSTLPQKCELSIPVGESCYFRLEFLNFTLHPPLNGSCVVDQFHIPELSQTTPMLCGYNNNTHIYLDVRGLKTITLRVNLGHWVGNRRWFIKIARVACNVGWAPQEGCLQQFFDQKESVKSFNFVDDAPQNSSLLAALDYSICIRRENNRCYMKWSSEQFHLSHGNDTALVGDACGSENFVLIKEGYDLSNRTVTYDRFCGNRLSAIGKSNKSSNVYSSAAPYQIRVRTARRQSNMSLGFVLSFEQMLCFDPPVNGINFRKGFDPLAWLEKFRIW